MRNGGTNLALTDNSLTSRIAHSRDTSVQVTLEAHLEGEQNLSSNEAFFATFALSLFFFHVFARGIRSRAYIDYR